MVLLTNDIPPSIHYASEFFPSQFSPYCGFVLLIVRNKRVHYEFTVYDLLLDCYFQYLAPKPNLLALFPLPLSFFFQMTSCMQFLPHLSTLSEQLFHDFTVTSTSSSQLQLLNKRLVITEIALFIGFSFSHNSHFTLLLLLVSSAVDYLHSILLAS